jgi:hypothetical protein
MKTLNHQSQARPALSLQGKLYPIEILNHIAPLPQGPIFFKSGFQGIMSVPLFNQAGPNHFVIIGPLLWLDFFIPESFRQIDLRVSHQTHSHPEIPAPHPEVRMLSGGIPSFVIKHQIFRAMESQMKG